MPEPADTEVPLLKQILANLSSEEPGDTEVPLLRQIVSVYVASNPSDTEVPLLREWLGGAGGDVGSCGDTEVPILRALYVLYGGADPIPDTEVPLLRGIYNSGLIIPIAFWRADQNVTGDPVTAWSDGTNVLAASGGASPTVGTDFTPQTSVDFNGTANVMSLSPSPLGHGMVTGTIAFAFKTGAIGSARGLLCVEDGTNSFIYFAISGAGKLIVQNSYFGSTPYTCTGTTVLSANTQYQLMVDFDGSAYHIWLDGVSESFTNNSGTSGPGWFGGFNPLSVLSLYVGAKYTPATGLQQFFNGTFGVIEAFDLVLNSTQRQNVFNYLDTYWLAAPAISGEYLTPDSSQYFVTPDGLQYYQQP